MRAKFWAFALLFCFGMMAGFSAVLHDHDLDLSGFDQDCTPCHWSQSQTTLIAEVPTLTHHQPYIAPLDPVAQDAIPEFWQAYSSRSPPFTS